MKRSVTGHLTTIPNFDMPKRGTGVRRMKGRPITLEEFERMLEATEKVVGKEAADSWKLLLRGLWTSGLRAAKPPLISCPSRRAPTFYGGDQGGIRGITTTVLGDYVGNGGDTNERGDARFGLTPDLMCNCRFHTGNDHLDRTV